MKIDIDISNIENDVEQALADYIETVVKNYEDVIKLNQGIIEQTYTNTKYAKSEDFKLNQNTLFFGNRGSKENIQGTVIDLLTDEEAPLNIAILTDNMHKWELSKKDIQFKYIPSDLATQEFDNMTSYEGYKNIIILDGCFYELMLMMPDLLERLKMLYDEKGICFWLILYEESIDHVDLELLCSIFKKRVVFQSSIEMSQILLGTICDTESMPPSSFYIHEEPV